MGAICRENMDEKIRRLFKKEISDAQVVVTISGGIPYVEAAGVSVLTIDLDNAEDFTSKGMTRKIALSNGIVKQE